jgi:hypothetical protein
MMTVGCSKEHISHVLHHTKDNHYRHPPPLLDCHLYMSLGTKLPTYSTRL